MDRTRHLIALIFSLFAVLTLAADAEPRQPPAASAAQERKKPIPEVQPLLDAGIKAMKSSPPRFDQAEKLLMEALAVSRSRSDKKGETEALRQLGNLYSDRAQAAKSLDYYQQSLALSRTMGDKDGEALALLNIAILVNQTQPEKAIELCREALPLFQLVGNKNREAGSHMILGKCFAATGRYQEARDAYIQALAIYQSLGDELSQANVLFFLGNLYPFDGTARDAKRLSSSEAVGYFERAIPLFRKIGSIDMEARLHGFVAGIYFSEGRFDGARPHFEKALSTSRETKDAAEIAYALRQLSTLDFLQGRYTNSLAHDQEAIGFYHKSGDKQGEAAEWLHIGQFYTRFGQQKTALTNYQKALPLLRETGDLDNLVNTLHAIGEIYNILGDRKIATAYYDQVIPLLAKPTGPIMTQRNHGILAGIYFETKQYSKARDVLVQQLDYLQKTGITTAIPTTVSMLALAERSLGRSDEALKWYREEQRLTENSSDSLGKAITLSSIAEIEEEKGSLDAAEKDMKEAVALLETVRTSLKGLTEAKSTFLTANIDTYRQYLALLLRRNRPNEAFALTQKMKARGLADILTDGKVQLTATLTPEEREQERLLRQKSDVLNTQLVKEGVQNEIGSRKRAEAIKLQIVDTERELQVLEDRLYSLHPDLAEKRAARTVTLPEIARLLPEDTALLEYVSLHTGKIDETVLFVVTQRAGVPMLSAHILPIRAIDLRGAVNALQKACSNPRISYSAPARKLYATLVRPAGARIKGKRRLIVCPDGALWDTPFAALLSGGESKPSGRGGRETFLIDRFEVDYAYSATGATAAFGSRVRPGSSQRIGTVLAFANPAFGDEKRFGDNPDLPGQRPIGAASRIHGTPSRPIGAASRTHPTPSRPIGAASRTNSSPSRPIGAASRTGGEASRPIGAASRTGGEASRPIGAASRELLVPRGGHLAQLPGTELEAKALRSDFRNAVIHTGAAAQEATTKREAGKYRYLHFATHGFFNDAAPLLSAIVLALPDKASGEDGFLTAREIFDLDLHADMVVLSACNTARGETRSGEGIIGLTWALFAAGAPTQVVSQWAVNDASTAQLMQSFYGNLTKKKMKKGEALRQAALSLRRSHGTTSTQRKTDSKDWSHPYYWAPFILMGNWR